jgi:hypothetical protein
MNLKLGLHLYGADNPIPIDILGLATNYWLNKGRSAIAEGNDRCLFIKAR